MANTKLKKINTIEFRKNLAEVINDIYYRNINYVVMRRQRPVLYIIKPTAELEMELKLNDKINKKD